MNERQALRLYIILSRTYRSACELDKRRIRQYGLNQSEFGVLELLLHRGPQPIQQLARKVLLTSGSMTYVVTQLEKRGLIRRKPSSKDRRICYAELTEAGHALIAGLFPSHEAFIHRMMDVFSEAEAEILTEQLKHLGTSIEHCDKKEILKDHEGKESY